MEDSKKIKKPVLSALLFGGAALYNIYQMLTNIYISVFDTHNETTVISIKYTEIFSQTTGYTEQFSQYALEQPADFDSLIAEKIAFLCLCLGIIIIVAGIYSLLRDDNYTICTTGLVLVSVSIAVLWYIVYQVQNTFDKTVSLIESIFGVFCHFHSSTFEILAINILISVLLFITYLFHRKSTAGG